MGKLLIVLAVFYCFSVGAMDGPEPLPLFGPLSPNTDLELLNEQLKNHLLSHGQAGQTVNLVNNFYGLCQQNPAVCTAEFYRDFTQLKLHQLLAAAYTPHYLWKQQVKYKINNQMQVTDAEVISFVNAITNSSIITTFCQHIKALAQQRGTPPY